MRNVLSPRVGGVLAVIAAIALAWLAVPSVANAAEGGCRKWSDVGYSLQACFSNEGLTAYSDMYLDQLPADCRSVRMSLVDRTATEITQQYFDCSLGHRGPIVFPMGPGEHYRTKVCVERDGGGFCVSSREGWF